MSDDYVCAGRRKTRSDKRAKARYMRYKKGGAQRVSGISLTGARTEIKRN